MSKVVLLLIVLSSLGAAHAQQRPIDGVDARSNPAEFAKQLGSTDPLVRQRSAEALARLAATDQRKLVEGYQLQEKNKEVRLALDWALYRMGKAEALYRVVDDLDSGRQEQAVGYLSELESPDVLYPFLKTHEQRAANQRRTAESARAHRRRADARSDQAFSRIASAIRRRSR